MTRAGPAVLFAVLAAACGACGAQALDPDRSRIEFDVSTRVGATVRGRFPVFTGRVDTLDDGRRQVRLRLSARDLVIAGSPRYTRLARGPQLFHAERYPVIEFESDPYPPDVAQRGGPLVGQLRMHGAARRETFQLAPSTCDAPGHGCPILATGRISRDDYALEGWRLLLADRVRFRLDVRFAD